MSRVDETRRAYQPMTNPIASWTISAIASTAGKIGWRVLWCRSRRPSQPPIAPPIDCETVQDDLRDPPAAPARLGLVDRVGDEGGDRPGDQPGRVRPDRPDDRQDDEQDERQDHQRGGHRPAPAADHWKRRLSTTGFALGHIDSRAESSPGSIAMISTPSRPSTTMIRVVPDGSR